MSKVENGKTVSVHYVGTLDDGTEFDSSRAKGEPMSFEFGARRLIPGFEDALVGMEVGQTKEIHITAEDAYGHPNPELVQQVPRTIFPEDYEFKIGTGDTRNSPILDIAKMVSLRRKIYICDEPHAQTKNSSIDLVNTDKIVAVETFDELINFCGVIITQHRISGPKVLLWEDL